jgi:FLVCR family MFS transporter 7
LKSNYKIYPYRWVVLAAFMFITFVIEIQWLAHAAVARPAGIFFEGQFATSSFFNIDFLAMVYMLVYLIMSIPASYVIDTYGIKTGLGAGAVLLGISGLVKGVFAADFQIVLFAQIGLAIAQPFILNAVTAVSVRWFPLKERGLAAGLSVLAQYLGIIVAMLVTPLMIGTDPDLAGYGQGFEKMGMIYGILSLIAAVVSLILIKEYPPTPPSEEEYVRHGFFEGIRYIFRQRDMLITLALFTIGLGIFNAISSMTDAIAANIGVKDSDGLIGGLMLIGGVIGALVIPVLSDKQQKRKKFLVICMTGAVPGILGLTFAGFISTDLQTGYTIALISSFILGFFIMSAGPIGFQYAAEVSAPAPESTSQGLLLLVGQVSGLIFVAGMSMHQNAYLNQFMILFSVLSFLIIAGVLYLKESPLMNSGK